ncbi:MAG: YkgJ family cysteine cluster protein [Lysobacter sp.]|nr:MAG: YkgJ family cysteine cluster protein [Lysobacter sp.]
MSHPCLSCGACCAAYRVSLHWSEAEPSLGGVVPVALTEVLDAHQRCMRGTWSKQPRCVALEGDIGGRTHCTIYDARPSACRELRMSWEDGAPNPQCDRARALYSMAPLTKEDAEAGLAAG